MLISEYGIFSIYIQVDRSKDKLQFAYFILVCKHTAEPALTRLYSIFCYILLFISIIIIVTIIIIVVVITIFTVLH